MFFFKIDTGITAKVAFDEKKLLSKVEKMEFKALRQTGGFIRKIARQQIKYRANPRNSSAVGTPPHTHPKGKYGKINMMLKNSIVYDVETTTDPLKKTIAVVGTSFNIADKIGQIHEFGNPFVVIVRKDHTYIRSFPPRPFMNPALMKSIPYLPKFWEGTLR